MNNELKIDNQSKAFNFELPVLPLEKIPQDILISIFADLDLKTRATYCLVSKQWKAWNQSYLTDVSIIISIFNKKIPMFIGYNYQNQDKIINHILKTQPEIKNLDPSSYLKKLSKHVIVFKGKIEQNEFFSLDSIQRHGSAAALEFDEFCSDRLSRKLTNFSSSVIFTIESTWQQVDSSYNGNYSQWGNSRAVIYDINTHSCYQIEHLQITYYTGSPIAQKTLDYALQILNQRNVLLLSKIYSQKDNAKLWSKSLLEGNYLYI